jgi:transcriptional regulator with XRE-family HTH domain
MSKTLLEKYAAAVRKRDKWTRRAESLAVKAGIVSSSVKETPNPDAQNEFSLGGKYYGIQTLVARRLGLHIGTVNRVVRGQRRSEPISAALKFAMKEADANPPCLPRLEEKLPRLSPEERKYFINGGPGFGGILRVANRLGISRSAVQKAASGKTLNNAAIRALREEIATPKQSEETMLSEKELALFKNGQPLFGAFKAVSHELGVTRQSVYRVAHGITRHNPRIMNAIKEKIAAVTE